MPRFFYIIIVPVCFFLGLSVELTAQVPQSQQKVVRDLEADFARYESQDDIAKIIETGNKLGHAFWNYNEPDKAAFYYQKSLKVINVEEKPLGVLHIQNSLGAIYADLGQLEKAKQAFVKALEISRQQNRKRDIASNLMNVGMVIRTDKQYEEALAYYEEALVLIKELQNEALLKQCYSELATIYEKLGDHTKSFEYFNLYHMFLGRELKKQMEAKQKTEKELVQSGQLLKGKDVQLEQTRDSLHLADSLNLRKEADIKGLEQEKEKTLIALNEQAKRVAEARQKMYALGGIIGVISLFLIWIFSLYRSKNEINKKLESQKEQIEAQNRELEKLSIVASEIDNAVIIMDKVGNFEWVNPSFTRLFGYTYDQLVSEVSPNIVGKGTPVHVSEQIAISIKEKKTVNYQQNITSRKGKSHWVQATVTPILDADGEVTKLVAIDSDISKLKEAEFHILEQSQRLEMQNENIRASLRYAHTIQQAILPGLDTLNAYLDAFVLYRPKDIVSGDFYWFAMIEDIDTLLIAVVDCTGHGVPGAFMSMIGSRLLNEIVMEQQVYDPAEVLERLNDQVVKALRQNSSNNNDGMDVALCSIRYRSEEEAEVIYSGAKRSLYYVFKDSGKSGRIKGSSFSIGGRRRLRENDFARQFTTEVLNLKNGDMLYLTSDGLVDQSAPDRRKFGHHRFIALIEGNAHKPTNVQEQVFNGELDAFKEDEEQRDDITVIGVKL